jgi:hypothetical protein
MSGVVPEAGEVAEAGAVRALDAIDGTEAPDVAAVGVANANDVLSVYI